MELRQHELHEALMGAFEVIENDVCGTMGAAGGSVVVDNPKVREDGVPFYFTKDGITVLRELCKSDDRIVSKVATLMLTSINRQWKDVGDGTTTATLLTCAFYRALSKELESGRNVHQVVKEAKVFVQNVIAELKKQAQPCDTVDKLVRIATISANNDAELGKLIGEATFAVGKYGTIDVQKHDLPYTEVEITKGYVIDGVSDPYMTNIHGNYFFESDLDVKPRVLLTLDMIDRTDEAREILLLHQALCKESNNNVPLIVICTDISPNALHMIKANQEANIKNRIEAQKIFFIRHKKEGQERIEYMADLAKISGAEILSKHAAKPILSKTFKVDVKHLGIIEWVKTSDIRTILKFPTMDLSDYVAQIEKEINGDATTEERKKWLKSRAARLAGSIGFLRVGAMTKQEQAYNDDLVDDAVRNTKAAFEDGYLLGGGLALRNVGNFIFRENKFVSVLREVHAKVQTNAHGSVNQSDNEDYCNETSYDLFTSKQINYNEAGIYDSFRGVKTALEVSVSLASEFVKTYKIVIE